MTDEQLQEIEDRAARATAGPWVAGGRNRVNIYGDQVGHYYIETDALPEDNTIVSRIDSDQSFADDKNNAALMAASREDVPALCKELRDLKVELAIMRRLLNDAMIDEPMKQKLYDIGVADGATLGRKLYAAEAYKVYLDYNPANQQEHHEESAHAMYCWIRGQLDPDYPGAETK